MSTNLIDEMDEREAKHLLSDICSELGIGGQARTPSVVKANIGSLVRRSRCLSEIERHHTITLEDDEGEEYEEQLLSWGESPDEYMERYKVVIGA